ncbi:MAG: chemotaxis protein CheA [Nitrospiraceae bacterium]|nr:chemotaxis protein CheA [Nitrospiraceae bacterium]
MEFSELIKDFLDDADGHLAAFDGALMSLEQNGFNRDTVTGTLGSLHTLKGNAGMMGYESLKAFVHEVEGILKKVLDNDLELGQAMGLLFDSAHIIRNTLREIGENPRSKPELTEGIGLIRECLNGGASGLDIQPADPAAYLGTKTDTIKVDFKKLNDLLNLVGELVIYKTRLNQIETQIRGEVRNKATTKELKDGLDAMGKMIAGLQEGIMRARMLPVSTVFHKFPRMVRDLAKAQGKEIRLAFEGEDTELDKTIIDELEEPLLHIIRNAVDHGIEPPRERSGLGKPHSATITLSAGQESNYVIIKVMDDGRGMDVGRIREAAARKGLIGPDDQLSKEAALSLIFSAGFTTKQEATDVSGRGIGLDVVSRNISNLNGQVSADSVPGKGTLFTIKLPLSLAIIPALMTEAGGEVFAIPLSAVDESIKVRDEAIHIINNREVIRFRNRVMPVIRLDEFFGLSGKRPRRLYLVILGSGEKRVALAVSRLRGQQEIVIKPLDDTFGKSFGIAGASILGDGRVVLIIDVTSFWNGKVNCQEKVNACE